MQLVQHFTLAELTSFAPALRRALLTAHFGPGGTTYTAGV